jgi:hypothetical protein
MHTLAPPSEEEGAELLLLKRLNMIHEENRHTRFSPCYMVRKSLFSDSSVIKPSFSRVSHLAKAQKDSSMYSPARPTLDSQRINE